MNNDDLHHRRSKTDDPRTDSFLKNEAMPTLAAGLA